MVGAWPRMQAPCDGSSGHPLFTVGTCSSLALATSALSVLIFFLSNITITRTGILLKLVLKLRLLSKSQNS